MKIAIILVHNKGDRGNFDQIENVKTLIRRITDKNLDENGEEYDTYHYEFNKIANSPEIRFYQIVPFGVSLPSNFYDIDSHNVIYRNGDEDKVGNHSRFLNWGVKRSIDFGSKITLYLEDSERLNINDVIKSLDTLADLNDKTSIIDNSTGKFMLNVALDGVEQLDESKELGDSLFDLKNNVQAKGLEVVNG